MLFIFFFNDTATTEIYTLSLHDALPISGATSVVQVGAGRRPASGVAHGTNTIVDRKSTRLNSSHSQISYAVFCLKKKKKISRGYCIVTNTHLTTCLVIMAISTNIHETWN